MFKLIFQTLQDVARQPIHFAHIHQEGLRTVTVDMCKKQAPGKIKYIDDIYRAYAEFSRIW